MSNVGFKIVDGSLIMRTPQDGKPSAEHNFGVWIPSDEEHVMRLFARVHRAGRESKRRQIADVISNSDS
jgi:hypothetical protein